MALTICHLYCVGTAAQTNKGLDHYNFFYTGENFNDRYMFIVKDGHVVWKYHETENTGNDQNGIPGEISDAVWMKDNGIYGTRIIKTQESLHTKSPSFYNLKGQHILKPRQGIYVVQQQGTNRKTMIR